MGRLSPLYRVRVDEIRRRHIIALRNQYRETPSAANMIVVVVGVLIKLAVTLEYRESGITGVDKLPVGERRRWADRDIAFALEQFPEHLRRAVVLALYTGQRSGDLAASQRIEDKIAALEEIRFRNERVYNYSAVVEAIIQSGFDDIEGGTGGPFNPRLSSEIVSEVKAAISDLKPYH